MIDFSKMTTSDWIAIYGASLSTAIAIVAFAKTIFKKMKANKERNKFQSDLYLLQKVDKSTKEVFPIVVVLLANLGTERIALKSLDYSGVTENGIKTTGCMGWYEQPEELYGIRNRLLPAILDSGETADLPIIEIGTITRTTDLKIWLTDFESRRYYLADADIEKVKRDIEKFLSKQRTKIP